MRSRHGYGTSPPDTGVPPFAGERSHRIKAEPRLSALHRPPSTEKAGTGCYVSTGLCRPARLIISHARPQLCSVQLHASMRGVGRRPQVHFVGHGRQLLKFTCLQQQPMNVLNMMMPLAVCGLLALAVGLVLTTGAGDRRTPSHAGHLLAPTPARLWNHWPHRRRRPAGQDISNRRLLRHRPTASDLLVEAGAGDTTTDPLPQHSALGPTAGPADPAAWSWSRGEVTTIAEAAKGMNASAGAFYHLWQQASALTQGALAAMLHTVWRNL